jgi:hypothetical protein
MQHLTRTFIETKNYAALGEQLSNNPKLANEGIPFDEVNTAKAHPLHRICDSVFAEKITDEEGIQIARIFLQHGARINGDHDNGGETPLIAAASLHAEQLGIFYIRQGADINFMAPKGASALHWAAYTGRDKLAKELIDENAAVDSRDNSHSATPIGWAVHLLKTGNEFHKYRQVKCIKLLLEAGADKNKLDEETIRYLQNLSTDDSELKKLLV